MALDAKGAGSVLIAEDDAGFRQLLVKWASRLGLRVTEAGDGSLAEELISRRLFDLLVLDIYLPGPSGLEYLRLAKEKDPPVQAIILTGNATVEYAVEALRHDAFDYLEKPFDSAVQFQLTLRRALERRQLLAENERLFQEVQQLAIRDP